MNRASQSLRVLELPYRWAGREGRVRVEIWENDDPAAVGCSEMARGFPCCRATIAPPARGYADMLGWVQLLDVSTRPGGFHRDGFEPLGPLPHPFGFYGIAPTFFDAPHDEADPLEFRAHAFLCGVGGELLEFRREAHAVIGFDWGFSKHGREIEFFGPDPLPASSWDGHLDYLRGAFPEWTFAPGFVEHPLRP
ncbi:MAG TPA: hypothetical protein VFS64_06500 [Solirubrobacterales bacterium]|nr:hypothetical protein [Solirubrobacterales bacterium]